MVARMAVRDNGAGDTDTIYPNSRGPL